MAMEYLIQQYKLLGIEPKGSNGFVQEFEINEGLQIEEATFLEVSGKKLLLNEEYFPVAFSANKAIKGTPAIALSEAGQPWFRDLKELLEENKTNPHFDVEAVIKKIANEAAAKNATSLLIYNTSSIVDNVQFNKNDQSPSLSIPVIYITKKGVTKNLGQDAFTATKFDLSVQQATNKLSPSAKLLVNYMMSGRDKNGIRKLYGEEYKFKNELAEVMRPIYFNTVIELLQDDPTALDGMLLFYGFFGGGIGIQEEKKKPKYEIQERN
jgi:hypothetical protein